MKHQQSIIVSLILCISITAQLFCGRDISLLGGTDLQSVEGRLCNMQTCLTPAYLCDREKPSTKFSGYIRSEGFYDYREVVSSAESNLSLYPKRRFLDTAIDIYDNPLTNMVALQTRGRADFFGPTIHSWKTYGVIEADFLGSVDATAQNFHMRHGFVAFNNDQLEVLLGQYWHPITPPDCYPDTVAFNYGLPCDVQPRDTQVRCTYFNDKYQFIGAALWQTVGYQSFGPDGASGMYLRRDVLPNIHLQGRVRWANKHLFGVGFDYKKIVPRVVNSFGNTIHETIKGFSGVAYYTGNFEKVTFMTKMVYGQNIPEMITIGGYGVSSFNILTDERCYTPFQTLHAWIFLSGTRCDYTPGLFVGVVKNLGTVNRLYTDVAGNTITYGRDPNVSYVWRVAPHLKINYKAVQFAGELEYTCAAYGTLGRSGKPRNNVPVANIRALLVAIYYF